MKTLKELRQARAQKIARMKEINDLSTAEERDLSEEEQTEYDELKGLVETLQARIARMEEVEELVEESERSLGTRTQPGRKAPAFNKTKGGDSEERAWAHWLRTGDDGGIKELRASNDTDMNIGTQADGGYAVPTGHYQGIIARRDEDLLAPKLGVMNIPGKGTTVNVTVDAEADGEFVATTEANDFDRDAPALGTVAMTLVLYSKTLQLSYQLLEDEDSRLLAFLSEWVGRGMARTHNSLLLTEARANGTAALSLDAAASIGDAEIPELVYKLPGEYADGAAWVIKRATEGLIRGAQGDPFLYVPNPAGTDRGRPEIWGYPVYNSEYASGVQASAKSLLFGNFRYVGLREAPGLTFLRDPYSLARKGQVQFHYYFRAVYKVLQAEAIVYATHPTA
jgi:HK97 family phage major capsid protein